MTARIPLSAERAFPRAVSSMTPAELALQREAEARDLAGEEAHAIDRDARALLARCEQYARLNGAHAGFRHAVHELVCAMKLRAPTLSAILAAQELPQ